MMNRSYQKCWISWIRKKGLIDDLRGAICGKKNGRVIEWLWSVLSPPCSRCCARASDLLEIRNVNATFLSYPPIVSGRWKRENVFIIMLAHNPLQDSPWTRLSLWLIRCVAGTSVAISDGCFASAAVRVAGTGSRLLGVPWTAARLILLSRRLGAASTRLRATVRWTARARSKKVYSIPITQHGVSSECLPRATAIRARAAATRRRASSATTASAVATLILHQANATSAQFRVVQLLNSGLHVRRRCKLNNPGNRWRCI